MFQTNPFLIEGYKSPQFFCDRREETALLIEHLTNQRNVTLIAKRRLGKSGLIHHCYNQAAIRDNFYTFYVDIYDTKDLSELTFELGKCVFNTLKSRGRKVWEAFLTSLKSLRTGITFDINGNPEWNLSIGELQNPDILLDEIFYYLEHADMPCIVAIDEFQVIADYPEKTVEATLRKRIQNSHNVRFIYSGSKRHMMTEMFMTQSRPFYNSSVIMGLQPINQNEYLNFANHHLQTKHLQISQEAFSYLYNIFEGTTWNIQYVLNVIFAGKGEGQDIGVEDVEHAIDIIVERNTFAYKGLLYLLAPKQKQVLHAIAAEGNVEGIMSKVFLQKYKLTSSTVQGAIKVLLDRDFVTNDEGVYSICDKFFNRWLR